MTVRVFLAALYLSAVHAGSAAPQPSAGPATLTGPVRRAVIESTVARLQDRYVEADTGRIIASRLVARLGAGGYDKLDNPAQFAEVLTQDLRSVNGDLHLSLRYAAARSPASGLGPGGPDPRERNFGLGKVEILDGNVGYLEITGFLAAPGYREAVVDALRFLSRTDALIIDLRRNGGGSGEMSHFIFSHFLPAGPAPTIRIRRRDPADTTVMFSLAEVPGPRRDQLPLLLVTSQNTASAGEEFSFVLKNRRRATIVGSRTAGAGHMVNQVPVGHGFVLGVSITRVSDPVTGREWEGTGVVPDVVVAAEQALLRAHQEALTMLMDKTPSKAATYGRLQRWLEARLTPPSIDPARLLTLTGEYEGRRIFASDGRLWYRRSEQGLPDELVPLGADRFAIGTTHFHFTARDGAPVIVVEPLDGTSVVLKRTR